MNTKNRVVLFQTPHGSHLYGTAHENSDYDTFTVVAKTVRSSYHNSRARQASQTIKDGMDETVVDLSTFMMGLDKGVPQYWEAAMSRKATLDKIPEFRASLRAGSAVLDTYLRTIKSFSFDDRDGGVKKRRHALRLGLDAHNILRYGRFDPTLPEGVGSVLWEIAEKYTPDEVYEMACNLVWNTTDFK